MTSPRLMDGATQVSCSGFGQVMIDNMTSQLRRPRRRYMFSNLKEWAQILSIAIRN